MLCRRWRAGALAVISQAPAGMSPLWSIVLAAGRGRRLASVTGSVPKQFWAPSGARSLLEETIHRIAPLGDPAHLVTVVDRSHRQYVERIGASNVGTCVYQPGDRGTANGVLLALSIVASQDPGAMVFVTPSDHGVARPEWFRTGVRRAVAHVEARSDDVVLIGVEASSPSTDYGWILQSPGGDDLGRVSFFVEKPARPLATRLMAAGALWNTMVLVARVSTLLDLHRRHIPAATAAFEAAPFAGLNTCQDVIDRLYLALPPADLSHDVLARARDLRCLAIGPQAGWTDLGTPDRLSAWLGANCEVGENLELSASVRDRARSDAGPVRA